MISVRISGDPLDLAAEAAALGSDDDTGAVATFLGLCRGEAGRLTGLELEHYPGMAEAEITRIAQAAMERWPVQAIHAVHRHGLVGVGEPIVFVAARSAHRDAAFDAVRFVMDFLKTEAPFWKREHLLDGTTGPWVEAKDADDRARERWAAA
ncbi:molybdenum cofactor biosynthesis protein MoaE [Acuticoccus mangrovi]|uniref:Molybdopterin synthase catalytic subunit n=1 Tax=Acuticoccus mangrovi TaxID=2796142 RepID=A0A934IMZ6_9HYPH|nr:molybdenum cofactor biosynthesis protein MoaE [Acuticoccus mangrovi]MBJ3776837.1 molybdenum cofactor biosynthesis protein MoaE [Acuticoccus mangrovi]